MKIGSLFSGIGALELGLELSGVGETVWQVEQSEFCLKVLEKHWPEVERFKDVRAVGKTNLIPVDLLCGGFPCQDVSIAGKGEGLAGKRSILWFEFARIVEEIAPPWVVVENVASGAKRWVDTVRSGLGDLGYETLPIPLSAHDVGAPHLRKRVFIIAHSHSAQRQRMRGPIGAKKKHTRARNARSSQLVAHSNSVQLREQCRGRSRESREGPNVTLNDGKERTALIVKDAWGKGPTVSPICGMDDGSANRVDRIRALGNAVVPQCTEIIGYMIRELEARLV